MSCVNTEILKVVSDFWTLHMCWCMCVWIIIAYWNDNLNLNATPVIAGDYNFSIKHYIIIIIFLIKKYKKIADFYLFHQTGLNIICYIYTDNCIFYWKCYFL